MGGGDDDDDDMEAGPEKVGVVREAVSSGEVLEGLADPHAGPVEGPGQGEQGQQQHGGPGGVDPRVGLGLHPRARHESSARDAEEQA